MFKNFGKDKDESKKEGADKEKGFSFSFGKKDESPPKVRGPSVAELQEQIESMQEQMAMLSQERRKEVTLARVTCCVPSSRVTSGPSRNLQKICHPITLTVSGYSYPAVGNRACAPEGCLCPLVRRR
jgi:hypothetical protein